MIKVRVTKEEIINAHEALAYFHFPRDIIVDGELVLEPVEEKREQYVCPACENKYPKSPIEEINELIHIDVAITQDPNLSYGLSVLKDKINELTRVLNTMRK